MGGHDVHGHGGAAEERVEQRGQGRLAGSVAPWRGIGLVDRARAEAQGQAALSAMSWSTRALRTVTGADSGATKEPLAATSTPMASRSSPASHNTSTVIATSDTVSPGRAQRSIGIQVVSGHA
jgi:hypothetical protein